MAKKIPLTLSIPNDANVTQEHLDQLSDAVTTKAKELFGPSDVSTEAIARNIHIDGNHNLGNGGPGGNV